MNLNEFYLRKNFNLDNDNCFYKEIVNFLEKNGFQIDLNEVIKYAKYNIKNKLVFSNDNEKIKIYLLNANNVYININIGGIELILYIEFNDRIIISISAEYFCNNNYMRLIDLIQENGKYSIKNNIFKDLEYFAEDFASNYLLICSVIKELSKAKEFTLSNTKISNKKSLC